MSDNGACNLMISEIDVLDENTRLIDLHYNQKRCILSADSKAKGLFHAPSILVNYILKRKRETNGKQDNQHLFTLLKPDQNEKTSTISAFLRFLFTNRK